MIKFFLLCLFCSSVYVQPVLSQTFAPRSVAPVKSVPQKKLQNNSVENKAVKSGNVIEDTGNNVPEVIHNFDGSKKTQNEEEKYDNTNRKAFSFRIVDGDIVFDDDAPRSILISYSNYEIMQGFDSMPRCSIRIHVLNDLTERINNFSFKLHWPDISTSVQMNRLNPGVSTYKDIILLGKGCFNLDKAPTIEVNRCRYKGMKSETECANAVRWYKSK